jgi:hypothetical protein
VVLKLGPGEATMTVESQSIRPVFQPLSGLLRALTVSDPDLTAEESASTFFRFFRSRHVRDLRLIFALAVFAFIIHLLIVMLVTRSKPVENYLFPAVPVYGAILGWAYLSASKRLGVVDLFACEITSLCRVGTIFDMGQRYVYMYRHGMSDRQSARSASFVSQEDYFPIFDSNSSDLEMLEASVVSNITEFYTFMKAARDSQRKLAEIDPIVNPRSPSAETRLDPWHAAIANLIYMMFLGYESARKSVDDLIEFEPTAAENKIVILLTELICYRFLCQEFEQDELRSARLRLREDGYKRDVPALFSQVNSSHGAGEVYWAPAKRTTLELAKRYQQAFNESIDDALARIGKLEARPTNRQ